MNHERRFHAGDILRGRERIGDEGLERRQILRHAFQKKIDFAGKHVAFAHLRPTAGLFLEMLEIGVGLAGQAHKDKTRDFVTEQLAFEIGVVALDVAGLLQRSHTAQTGRRGDFRPPRQLHIGDAAIGLQFGQNPQIDAIELVVFHWGHGWLKQRRSIIRPSYLSNNISTSGNFVSEPEPANFAQTCWVVTDGTAGMENQALGLAERLDLPIVTKRVKLRWPWNKLAPYNLGSPLGRLTLESSEIVPPWPLLAIGVGRQSIPVILAIK